MDKFIELSAKEAADLLAELKFADAKGISGLYKLRVYVDDTGAKFKVNELCWSPPLGKMVRGS